MKHLLTILGFAAVSMTGMAQKTGDYIYTNEGRFKVVSDENLVVNGDFSNGLNDWLTDTDKPLDADTFQIVQDGPDGSDCVYIAMKDNGPGSGSTLKKAVPVMAGTTYYITYSAKCDQDVTTTITGGANVKNYQNIFFNTDGSLTSTDQIAKATSYSTEWKTIAYSYTPEENGYIVYHFYGPYLATRFDDFKVMEVQKVPDDREVENVIARLEAYRDNPLFPNGHETMDAIIAEIRELLKADDFYGMETMFGIVDNEVIPSFLDYNTVNVTSYIPKANFDDLTPTSAIKSGTETTFENSWTVTDVRWKVAAADDVFPTNYISRNIPGDYTLKEGKLFQTIPTLPAGKYIFTMKCQAAKYSNKNNTIDEEYDIRGFKLFINNDSTEMYPIRYNKIGTYDVIGEVKEGESVTIGFYMPGDIANDVKLDYTELRAIGMTQEDIDNFFNAKKLEEVKKSLKTSIDSAVSYISSAYYLYEKDILQNVVDEADAVWQRSTDIEETEAERDSINDAIKTFIKHNSLFTTLKKTIDAAQQQLDNNPEAKGRKELADAISVAVAFADGLTPDKGTTHEDSVAVDQATVEHTKTLEKALAAFTMANTGQDDDEKYEFAVWGPLDNGDYRSLLAENPIETSSGALLYTELSNIAGNSLNGRIAFYNTKLTTTCTEKGLSVTYSGKNSTVMAVTELNAGDRLTLDWAMANASHSVYVSSGNAKYSDNEGSEVEFTLKGQAAKKESHKLVAENTNGIGGMTRTVITMTADGTLDFFLGSSNSTLRIGYLGIKKVAPNGIGIIDIDDKNQDTHGVYSLSGIKVADSLADLPKGIYIVDGVKVVVK